MYVIIYLFYTDVRPAYPSVFDRISMEIGRQNGYTGVFLKIRTKSEKERKSRQEEMQVHCQQSR